MNFETGDRRGPGARRRIVIEPRATIHNQQPTTNNRQPTTRLLPGFSFAEVMFAVVILGIGFILVAAIFPVAIQQSQATGEESIAAVVGDQTAHNLGSIQTIIANPIAISPASATPFTPPSQLVQSYSLFPPTVKNYVQGTTNVVGNLTTPALIAAPPPAIFVPLCGAQWEAIKGNLILPSDPRYAGSVLYRRESGSPFAQFIIVAMASRQRPIYDPNQDLVIPSSGTTPSPASAVTVKGFPVQATPQTSPPAGLKTHIYPDQITVTGQPVAEGFTVAPTVSSAVARITGKPAGRYYRLGRQVSTLNPTFEIDPGSNMNLTAGTGGAWGAFGATTDTQLTGEPVNVLPPPTLQPVVAYAQLIAVPNSPGGRIQLVVNPTAGASTAPPSAATGAFVVVADDYPCDPNNPSAAQYDLPLNQVPVPGTKQVGFAVGAQNGRIFRLGKAVVEDFEQGQAYPPGTFDIDPQYGMLAPKTPGTASPDTTNSFVKVYLFGMAKTDATVTTGLTDKSYSKGAQEIGVYSTILPVQ